MPSLTTRVLTVAVLLALTPMTGGAGQVPSLSLLQRAANPNPTLASYTASAQLSAILHAVLPIRKSVSGTVYYLKPNRKIVFQNLSGPLAKFKEMAASAPTYDQAMTQYTITPLTDDGTTSTYSAVPKNTGSRVKSVTIGVNDRSALVSTAHWAYTNGGSLVFNQTYSTVGTFRLPAQATIAARFPGYSVDGTLTFSNYQPNATVAPSVFASPH